MINTARTDSDTAQEQTLTWWQREDLCYQDGDLYFAGQSVANLVREVRTPGFVYSMARVRQNLERLHLALETAGSKGNFFWSETTTDRMLNLAW